MPIALSETHVDLAKVARSFLESEDARGAARALLDASEETLPPFWNQMAELGWLGLHLPEGLGGAGFGLLELLIVTEELGHSIAPGPFLPTVIVSSSILRHGDEARSSRWLPGLADGSTPGAISLAGGITLSDKKASGRAAVLSGGLAKVLAFGVGDDLIVMEAGTPGVRIDRVKSYDPTRRFAEVTLAEVDLRSAMSSKELPLTHCRYRRRSFLPKRLAVRLSAWRWRPSMRSSANNSGGRSRPSKR